MTDPYAWVWEWLDTALDRKMGLEMVSVSPTEVVGRLPVAGNTQPFGLLNGGVSAYLAETLASTAALVEVGPHGSASGVDLNVTHHASARHGWVTGVARPIRVGRTIASYEVHITDESDKRLCTARLTVFLKRAKRA